MKFPNAGLLCLFAAIAIIALGANGSRGNVLEASARMSSVSISITLNGATFPPVPQIFNPLGDAEVNGNAGPQVYTTANFGQIISSGSVFTPHSVGPVQVTDPATASIAQSTSSIAGAMSNGNSTFSTFTTMTVSATSAASARAGSIADTGSNPDTVIVGPFAQPTSATIGVDLMSDFGTNPNSMYSLQSAPQGQLGANNSSQVSTTVEIRSNLPGATTLFFLNASDGWFQGNLLFGVNFSSNVIAQPVFASDFIASPNGTFSLDPNKREISIPLTIPAGFQLALDTGANMFVQIVPEPASFIPALFALIGLLGFARKRR